MIRDNNKALRLSQVQQWMDVEETFDNSSSSSSRFTVTYTIIQSTISSEIL